MTRADDRFAELRDILEALFEDRLTDSQASRLERLAFRDAASRRFYLEYIDLHGNLHWDAAQGIPAEELEPCVARENRKPAPRRHRSSPEPVVIASPIHKEPARRSRLSFALAIVAAVGLAAALVVAAWVSPRAKPAQQKSPVVTVEHDGIEHHESVLNREPAAATGDWRHRSTVPPAGSADAAPPTTRPGSSLPTMKTVTAHHQPAQFQLAVATKSAQPVKAALIPLDLSRSPVARPSRTVESPASSAASEEGKAGSVGPVAFIDARLQSAWKSAGVEPSPLATDEEWIRRVYLDVVGHIPPEEAVDAFLNSDVDHKRAALVDRLLQDPGYARNWATLWVNLLVGRQPRAPGVRRDDLEKFLRDRFAANAPWNDTVFALVSAEGRADTNPAANFLLAHLNQDAVPATALTARLFLCIQMQCTQCHDHPFTKDKQNRFWEFNSFFQQTEVVSHARPATAIATAAIGSGTAGSMETGPSSVPEIVTRSLGGPMYYETLRGEMRAAYPVYAGHKIDPAPTINRRRELARLIAEADDRQLASAMVNRTWQHFFGQGFTRPVDDMGSHNMPNHPQVLERLAREFAASGYDLKQLIRWICATDAYQRASTRTLRNASDDPAAGAPPLFSYVYLKPLSAEELYDSVLVATRAKSSSRTDWNDAGRRREDWVSEFVHRYATEENDEATLPAGSVSQALTMMNDRIVEDALSVEPGTLLFDVVHDTTGDTAKIRRLSRAALARNPTRAELRVALARLRDARKTAVTDKGSDAAAANALSDIFWAYLNANEFALVH